MTVWSGWWRRDRPENRAIYGTDFGSHFAKYGWLEVLNQIRRAGYTLQVMILSARDDISDRVKVLDGGADEYIGKPFALEELLARLRVIIRRSSGSAEELISVGILTFHSLNKKFTTLSKL